MGKELRYLLGYMKGVFSGTRGIVTGLAFAALVISTFLPRLISTTSVVPLGLLQMIQAPSRYVLVVAFLVSNFLLYRRFACQELNIQIVDCLTRVEQISRAFTVIAGRPTELCLRCEPVLQIANSQAVDVSLVPTAGLFRLAASTRLEIPQDRIELEAREQDGNAWRNLVGSPMRIGGGHIGRLKLTFRGSFEREGTSEQISSWLGSIRDGGLRFRLQDARGRKYRFKYKLDSGQIQELIWNELKSMMNRPYPPQQILASVIEHYWTARTRA